MRQPVCLRLRIRRSSGSRSVTRSASSASSSACAYRREVESSSRARHCPDRTARPVAEFVEHLAVDVHRPVQPHRAAGGAQLGQRRIGALAQLRVARRPIGGLAQRVLELERVL